MPIYEFYCPDNHRIYQFFAKTLAQGATVPECPDNPRYKMQKLVSRFAVAVGGRAEETPASAADAGPESDDPRIEAAMKQMEQEFSSVDENDPKAMGRMMRRMAELSGEKIDGQMEEVMRKLEEGADPESLEEQMGGEGGPGGEDDPYGEGGGGEPGASDAAAKANKKEARARYRIRRLPPVRDPKMYDYE